jgi:hypothetical protein
MAKFSKIAERIKPGKVVVLQPSAFSPSWEKVPRSAIAVGLRGVSDGDESTARAEAEKILRTEFTHEDPQNAVDCYNDLLMRQIVSRGICDVNDATKPHDLLRTELTVRFALTSRTVRYLFEELERMQIETSPLHPEATDDDLRRLAAELSSDHPFAALLPVEQRRMRRLLQHVLSELDPSADQLPQ